MDPAVLDVIMTTGEVPATAVGEHLTEAHRLIAKRIFTLIVEDDEVKKAVNTIIETNQTGNPGDGRIFILPVREVFTIRTFEQTTEAY